MPRTLSAPRRKRKTELRANDRWSSLVTFDAQGCDLLTIDRPAVCNIDDAFRDAVPLQLRGEVTTVDADQVPGELLAQMGTFPDELAADMSEVCRRFLSHFKLKKARLRVELCTTTTCPKCHHDHVMVRMVTTYAGAGTQWHHVKTPQTIVDASPWSLLFLKGCKHPTHDGTILHRSPPMAKGDRRLCMLLDD